MSANRHHLAHPPQLLFEIKHYGFHCESTGLDFREIEDVVDQVEERFAITSHDIHESTFAPR
jgi:hypothetical protein